MVLAGAIQKEGMLKAWIIYRPYNWFLPKLFAVSRNWGQEGRARLGWVHLYKHSNYLINAFELT